MSADTATVAEQEYLESMFWIDEAGLPMTGANIARAMQLSAPTVHEMVGRLVKDGYVERNPDKSLKFTEEGREKIVGGARYGALEAVGDCEFAVAIVDEWHGLGLARRLLKMLIERARASGFRRMDGYVLATNLPMMSLAKRLGFAEAPSSEGPAVRVVRRDLA